MTHVEGAIIARKIKGGGPFVGPAALMPPSKTKVS